MTASMSGLLIGWRMERVPLDLSLRGCGISDYRLDRRGSFGLPAAHRAKPRGGRRGAQHNVIPVEEVRVGTSPAKSAVILHLMTADYVPLAVEMPVVILREVVEQLQQVLARVQGGSTGGKRLH
jgi:hypothetical protein